MSILDTLDCAARAAFESLGFPSEYGRVSESDRPDLAPFQCNGAMAAAGFLKKQGKKTNPRKIATQIVEALEGHPDIADLEIAGPGFINITPTSEALTARIKEITSDERLGAGRPEAKTIVIDYGGANVAKPMHVGHLRSAVIGESLKRILRYLGHKVIGDVHLGDWGLQMGHLITELRSEQPNLPYFDSSVTGGYPSDSPVTMQDMERLYPTASRKSKEDPARLKLSQVATADLQNGRPGYKALLDHFIAISIEYLKDGYGELGVSFDLWKGEASVDPLIEPMIDNMIAQGITVESDGALIVPLDESYDAENRTGTPPVMLRARTGAVLYHTTDLATLTDRKQEIDPDLILYVVDQRQALHFKQVFLAAVKAGWYEPDQLEHLGFGTVNGKDGKAFTTRGGGTLKLADLTSMMREAAHKRLAESGFGQNFYATELEDIADKVGMAALKFADLQNQRTTNYIFDVDRFTAFEGKTGPYLLYATVRIKSILKKAKDLGIMMGDITVSEPAERGLALSLDSFGRALSYAADKRAPHILCEHVFRLAQSFSRFYADCPILADSTPDKVKASRLALAAFTLRQLETGLDLLGIATPDRM